MCLYIGYTSWNIIQTLKRMKFWCTVQKQVNSEDDVLVDPTTHSMIASLCFHLDKVPTTAIVPETANGVSRWR